MTEFTFPFYLWALPFVGAFITGAITLIALAKGKKKPAIVTGIVTLVLALLFGPGMMSDKVILDDQGLSYSAGIIFMKSTHTIQFEDFDEVRVESMRGRKGKKKVTWNLYSQGKKVEEISLNTIMKLYDEEIYEAFLAKNIKVTLP